LAVGDVDGVQLAGRRERDTAIEQIAANYRQMIDVYVSAAAGTSPIQPARVEGGRR
jgi:hypothetical protein